MLAIMSNVIVTLINASRHAQQTHYDRPHTYVHTFPSFLGSRGIPRLVRLLIIGSLPSSLSSNFRGWPILASAPLCIIATHPRANRAQRDLETRGFFRDGCVPSIRRAGSAADASHPHCDIFACTRLATLPPPPLFFNSRPLRDFERAKNFLVENREIENGKGAGIILLTILSLSPSLIPFFARFFRLRGILMREGENYSRSFSRHRRFSEQLTFVDLEILLTPLDGTIGLLKRVFL